MTRRMLPKTKAIAMLQYSCIPVAEFIIDHEHIIVDNRGYTPKVIKMEKLEVLESKSLEQYNKQENGLPFLTVIDMGRGHIVPVYGTKQGKKVLE